RLTEQGQADVREAARGMARLGLRFDLAIASPLVRSQETAAIVVAETGPDCPLVLAGELVPDSSPQKVYTALAVALDEKAAAAPPPPAPILPVGPQPPPGE